MVAAALAKAFVPSAEERPGIVLMVDGKLFHPLRRATISNVSFGRKNCCLPGLGMSRTERSKSWPGREPAGWPNAARHPNAEKVPVESNALPRDACTLSAILTEFWGNH